MEEDEVELLLCKALEEISLEKQYQEKYLLMLVKSLQLCQESTSMEGHSSDVKKFLFSKYQLIVYSVLMTTLPRQFPGEDVTVLMKLFIHGRTRYQPKAAFLVDFVHILISLHVVHLMLLKQQVVTVYILSVHVGEVVTVYILSIHVVLLQFTYYLLI
ncbi:uncharacterized protein LOC112524106 [Cynara cardunculus var. scolymus]|uniref:uncharacterized protein LOC112524106 n=1 Tax=Cynara cardunculus var. scolymus TaxID=59895 RepID=UPI000D62DFC2|nr:uncharacterized protein LOC112524106 [Cynara cardunculus var. scolymus]XP_024989526.1 uncharacterized protein LOC112524106 [Cynara cardunculus var. scolymus]